MNTHQTDTPAGRTLLRAAVRLTLPLCALSLLSTPALAYSPDTSRLAGADVIRYVPMQNIGNVAGAADPHSPSPRRMQLAQRTSPLSQGSAVGGTRANLPPVAGFSGTRANLPPGPAFGGTRVNPQATPVSPTPIRRNAVALPQVPRTRPPVTSPGGTLALPQLRTLSTPPGRQFTPFPQRFLQPTRASLPVQTVPVQPAQAAPVAPPTSRAVAPAPRAIPQPVRSRAVAPAPVATPPAIPSSNPTGPVYSPGASTRGANVAQQAAIQQGARNLGKLKRALDAQRAGTR